MVYFKFISVHNLQGVGSVIHGKIEIYFPIFFKKTDLCMWPTQTTTLNRHIPFTSLFRRYCPPTWRFRRPRLTCWSFEHWHPRYSQHWTYCTYTPFAFQTKNKRFLWSEHVHVHVRGCPCKRDEIFCWTRKTKELVMFVKPIVTLKPASISAIAGTSSPIPCLGQYALLV